MLRCQHHHYWNWFVFRKMKQLKTTIDEVKLFEPSLFKDKRGYFFESYHQEKLKELELYTQFVQDNISHSTKDTLRGLHFQAEPAPQAKLVQVIQGEIIDIAVDIRKNSPTFKKYVKATLSDTNHHLLYIPEGFAHGFFVKSTTATIHYKCSSFYNPKYEKSIHYQDPSLKINWELGSTTPILSKKDLNAPFLKTP